MEEYMIQPWDNEDLHSGINLDMWVPPEIDELALRVITYYDMEVHARTLITSKPDKGGAIWKIETDKGPRSLKVLHRKPSRSLFSVGAQDYIFKQGGRVPELKKTKQGALYVEEGGKLWIVTDWIKTLSPASKDLEGALALCYGLGEFHRYSRGFVPPVGSQRATRLFRWPAYYQKIIKKLDWFRNIAKAYNDLPNSPLLLAAIKIFERQALDALYHLEQSSYAQMVSLGEEHWGLVHQDYGWSNGQLGLGGLWVIDLDGVAYDLPIRDLRKLISSTMDNLGKWDATWIRSMIDAYHQANPLDLETYDILLNDLAFPNEFYKHINEMLYDPINFINNDLGGIIQLLTLLEKTKGLALEELKLDQHRFRTGNYVSFPVIKPETLEMMQMTAIIKDEDFTENKTLPKNETPKLKVLMICTEKLPVPPVRGGAIQTYIQGISGMLSQQHDLTILGTTDPSLPLEEVSQNIRYARINGEQILEIYAEKVIEFLSDNYFDLIHVFNRPRLIPLIREVAPHSRIVLSMHNDMFDTHKIHPNDAVTAINEVERIITVSDYVGNTICNLYPQAASKVHTIYSGVNLDTFVPWVKSNTATQIRQKLREEYDLESRTVILFVGRLTPKKGTDLLIQALNEVHASDSNIALVIVGGTWYSVDSVTDYVAYVRALAERAPFPVITTGYVSAHLIHRWYWAGDIFVCPSQWQEPLARVHYEAMAAGLPFLTTARGGNPEVVIDQNGLIVEQPEDPIEFAEKLKILLTDPELRQSMGQTGRRIAEERFSWERVAHEVLETWESAFNYNTNKNEITPRDLDDVDVEDNTKVETLDELAVLNKDEIVMSLAMDVGLSVMKITRDMIFPKLLNCNSINYTDLSVMSSRFIFRQLRANIVLSDITSLSTVKITREMIVSEFDLDFKVAQ
ncbi:Spore coat protein, CotS family [Candidatus Desulfosporosinus infrequens]|uniref:Spore coat protein, CotS family n=1 Tax=Candidatus Desulfosporosinus infrequens TaxID=2043169 RepID=A0A2U3L212_9FIRM|nr:Spore coat protein, CotS family [Candidatus Desulfosporosinus infrequens]